ncbi:MAG: MucB/RseB C-terminal domain-containing protein [Methylococcales bacterium]|nr:MucB/RseB C-terminal domain-containing protein [Methylococcales bacterium]
MFKVWFWLTVLFATPVYAIEKPPTAIEWLTQMQHSMQSLNYQGTVVFFKNNKLDSMSYFHAVNKGQEQEYLLSLNSPMREILRNEGNVSCIFKDSKKVEINHLPNNRSFIIDLPENFQHQAAYYEFELKNQAKVAGLTAQVIVIKPKDELRYLRKIWVDQQHFIPLKAEVYNHAGAIIEQVMFTELKVKKNLPFVSLNIVSDHLKVKHIHQSHLQTRDQSKFVINNIPQGFEEVFFMQMKMHGSNQAVEHLLLSDGFSSVSIYQEISEEMIPAGIQSAGSINSLVKKIKGFQFVVIGDVPVKTIQLIAEGIRLKTP